MKFAGFVLRENDVHRGLAESPSFTHEEEEKTPFVVEAKNIHNKRRKYINNADFYF